MIGFCLYDFIFVVRDATIEITLLNKLRMEKCHISEHIFLLDICSKYVIISWTKRS